MIETDITGMVRRALEGPWDRTPGAGFSRDASMTRITGGGSDRHFLRVEEDGLSAVVLVQPGGGPEFERYVRIGDFLRDNGVAVPLFYFVDPAGVIVMEDLGDIHLVDALEEVDAARELAFYRDCVDILLRLRTSVTAAERESGILGGMEFSLEVLLGETDYFAAEFVGEYARARLPEGWERERRELAAALASRPRIFMHRDFQSRNIMVKDGSLRIVDFQTAHRGPWMYDVASLLKDPYHPVDPGTRKTLLMELYYRSREEGIESGGFDEFHDRFVTAGIQRNMQALAAFAHLGLRKGKREFLSFIEPGLMLLEEGLEESGRFPVTARFVSSMREKIGKGND